MADQRLIVLRSGDGTVTTIVLRPLPTADGQSGTIYLYAGHVTPSTIVLSNPRVARPSGTNSYSYTGSGGITFGGSASLSLTKAFAGSGGLAFGGSATLQLAKAFTGSGGIVFGGTATTQQRFTFAAAGGITFGGAAGLTRRQTYAGSGGITFGGQADLAVTKAFAGSGGLVLGGAASLSRIYAFSPSSGIVFGGAAATSYVPAGPVTYTYTGQGGIVFGGAADTVVTAAPSSGAGILPRFRPPTPPRWPVKSIPKVPALAHPVIFDVPRTWAGIRFGGAAVVLFRPAVVARQVLDVPAVDLASLPDRPGVRPALTYGPMPRAAVGPVTIREDEEDLLLLLGDL